MMLNYSYQFIHIYIHSLYPGSFSLFTTYNTHFRLLDVVIHKWDNIYCVLYVCEAVPHIIIILYWHTKWANLIDKIKIYLNSQNMHDLCV